MAEGFAAGEARGGFKAAHATGDDWGTTLKACLDALEPLPEGANLGFVYATDALAEDLGSILTFLRERTRIEDWVGTVGFGVSATGVEVYDRPAIAILVGALPVESYRLLSSLKEPGDGLGAARNAWIEGHAPVFGVVHGDPRNQAIAALVAGVSNTATGYLVGGLSGSRGGLPQIAGRLTEGGLSGVLFGSELPVATGLTQGCTPIGPTHQITEAEQNVIKTIDGRRALEVFKEDIGELLARDLRRVGGYIFAGFPVAGSDMGDYLVRNMTGIDVQQGLLQVGERVSAGQSILFCRRDHGAAERDLRRMLDDVKKRAGPAPKAGLYISCVARGQNLFGPNSEELKLVRESLGEVPLVGFFANGEICNDRLYGYTGVLALFL